LICWPAKLARLARDPCAVHTRWNRSQGLARTLRSSSGRGSGRLQFSALRTTPGQGVEPRSPRSERGVLPVRRSRTGEDGQAGPSVHLPNPGDRRSRRARPDRGPRVASYDSLAGSRAMFSKPLAYPSTLDRPTDGCASDAVDVLRGGVLEPEPCVRFENAQAKAYAYCKRLFRPSCGGVFLSQAGPRFGSTSSSS
jgi:hypothetical protein